MGEREWKGKQMQAAAVSGRYAEDKPVSCDYCYFQIPGKKACELDKCFYLLLESRLEPEKGTAGAEGCRGCPYGRIRPCIGFCMEKLLIEMRQKKCGKGGNTDAG